jgi:hypothetical protein
LPIEKHVDALLSGMEAWNAFNARMSEDRVYDFSHSDLSAIESFKGYQFSRAANFAGAKFRKLSFKASTFGGPVDFSRIEVQENVEINVNRNETSLKFLGSTFNGVVNIQGGSRRVVR